MPATASHWMLVEGTDVNGDKYETVGDIWCCISIDFHLCPEGEFGSAFKKDLDDAARSPSTMLFKCTQSHTMGRFEDVAEECHLFW